MEYLYIAFSVVFPLFLMMAIGYTLKRLKIMSEDFSGKLSDLCFKFFLPLTLFLTVYESDFSTSGAVNLTLFGVSAILISFLIVGLIIPLFEKENKNKGVMVQGICRSNFVLFGLTIASYIYPNGNFAAISILVVFAVPIFNLLSVVVLEIYTSKKVNVKVLLTKIIKNPMIVAALIGVFLVVLKLEIPEFLKVPLDDISAVTTPLALIALGGSFKFLNLSKYKTRLIISVIGKLVIIPGVFLTLAILLGFREIELVALLALLGSPTAVASFPMAKSLNGNHELAGQIVAVDSVFSVFTVFIWVSILMSMNLI